MDACDGFATSARMCVKSCDSSTYTYIDGQRYCVEKGGCKNDSIKIQASLDDTEAQWLKANSIDVFMYYLCIDACANPLVVDIASKECRK